MSIDKWIQHHKGDEPLFGLDRSKGINRSVSTEPLMTIEELEAKLEIVTKHRDEAKKEAAESFKEMVMLYNDHSSTELEQQLRIEELTRERDKFKALAEGLEQPMNDDTKPKQTLTFELWDDGEDGTVATCAEFPGPIGEGEGILEAVAQLLFKLRWERKP